MEHFLRERWGRYYIFERTLQKGECVIVEFPLVIYKSATYDIGIASTSEQVSFFATYSSFPERKTAIWKRYEEKSSSKSIRAIKISNDSEKKQSVCLRIAF